MFTRSIKEIENTERHVKGVGFDSLRLILAKDGMGFSVHKTIIPQSDTAHHWHYKNHLEACYCISGKAILTNIESGKKYNIEPGTIYALDKNDDHTFLPIEDTVLISIFNPPVKGRGIHNEDGSYE